MRYFKLALRRRRFSSLVKPCKEDEECVDDDVCRLCLPDEDDDCVEDETRPSEATLPLVCPIGIPCALICLGDALNDYCSISTECNYALNSPPPRRLVTVMVILAWQVLVIKMFIDVRILMRVIALIRVVLRAVSAVILPQAGGLLVAALPPGAGVFLHVHVLLVGRTEAD